MHLLDQSPFETIYAFYTYAMVEKKLECVFGIHRGTGDDPPTRLYTAKEWRMEITSTSIRLRFGERRGWCGQQRNLKSIYAGREIQRFLLKCYMLAAFYLLIHHPFIILVSEYPEMMMRSMQRSL